MMTLYKLTGPEGEPVHGGSGEWPLPTEDGPGEWRSVKGDIIPCRNGLHLLERDDIRRWVREGVLWETVHNSHALLAFFALSNADVVAARIVLDEHQAGLYAGGLILTKAVLFLPQFVVVIVFPSMSSSSSARRMNLVALALVAAIGLVTVAGVALLPDLALAFVGGPEYAEISNRLWVFALLGTVLAMLQVMVYNVVARQRQYAVFIIWAALAVVAVLAPLTGSVDALLRLVLVTDTVLLGALLAGAARGKPAAPRTEAAPPLA